MYRAIDVAPDRAGLRQRAVEHLSLGTPMDLKRASTSEAMTVLYQLASSPSTAGDALALLHELQVHQVELDLQQEELRNSRAELEAALLRQTARVERAPVSYMTLDARTVICEINLAGARLLGAAADDLLGTPLASLLSAPSVGALHTLLARAQDGLPPQTCELQLLPLAGVILAVHASADKDSTPGYFLLVLMAAASPSQKSGDHGF